VFFRVVIVVAFVREGACVGDSALPPAKGGFLDFQMDLVGGRIVFEGIPLLEDDFKNLVSLAVTFGHPY
jgi:hypothetical protein